MQAQGRRESELGRDRQDTQDHQDMHGGTGPIMGKEMLAGADAINCVPPVVWSRGRATLPRSGDGFVLVEGCL